MPRYSVKHLNGDPWADHGIRKLLDCVSFSLVRPGGGRTSVRLTQVHVESEREGDLSQKFQLTLEVSNPISASELLGLYAYKYECARRNLEESQVRVRMLHQALHDLIGVIDAGAKKLRLIEASSHPSLAQIRSICDRLEASLRRDATAVVTEINMLEDDHEAEADPFRE